jgi:hypothetical protein
MSSISSISNSLLDSILLNDQQSNSSDAISTLTSNIQTMTDELTQASGSNVTDIVTLSNNIKAMETQLFLDDTESNGLTGSDDPLNNILDDSLGFNTGNETALSTASDGLTGSSDPLNNILGQDQASDTSSTAMYDLFLSAENTQLMQANPSLVKDIISEEQAQTTTDSTSSVSQIIQDIGNINLLTISPDTLLAIQQKYADSANSETQATSGSQVNKTA